MEDLARMATFARVVELGAFSRAAKELGLTTSSVSQHIRALESSLSATLLNRTTRKLSLTEAGTIFYQHCAHIVNSANEAEQSVATLNQQSVGDLRIAVSTFMSTKYLLPAIDGFIKENPNVRLLLHVSDHNADLVERRIDVALRAGRDCKPGDILLGRIDGVLCAAPSYLDARQPISTPEDLALHDFVFFSPHGHPVTLELTNQQGHVARVRLQPKISADHSRTVKMLAMAGHGIARLLSAKIADELECGNLKLVLPEWHADGFDVFLSIRHKDTMPVKVQQCVEHIRSHFESLLK